MKILHIINSLSTGGAEKLLVETIPLYAAAGIEVDVLVLDGTEYQFYTALATTNSCKISSLGKGSVYNPLLVFKIMPYLKKYNAVHVHLFPAQYWVVLAKLIAFSKVPLLFTEHSTNNRRINSPIFRLIDKLIYRYYTKIVCISEEIANLLHKHTALATTRFEIIENGVDINCFSTALPYVKEQLNIKGVLHSDVLIIQVASFKKPKDPFTLIKSLIHVPVNVKLLLVGEGVMQEQLAQLVKTLQLEQRVHFLGVRTDVPRLLKTADIVVLSSHYEGLSLSSVEGMAAEKPFIASNVPGLKEVVGGAGLLFEKGNDKELATHIVQLINNATYYQQIATQCLERSKHYDISVMVAKHLLLYKAIVQRQ